MNFFTRFYEWLFTGLEFILLFEAAIAMSHHTYDIAAASFSGACYFRILRSDS